MPTIRVSVDLKITDKHTREVTRESFVTYAKKSSDENMAREVIDAYAKENKLKDCRVACTYIAPLVRYF